MQIEEEKVILSSRIIQKEKKNQQHVSEIGLVSSLKTYRGISLRNIFKSILYYEMT